jgi:hypothetical protein
LTFEFKTGFGFAGVYPNKRCAVAWREMFHATGATKPQRSQRLFITTPSGNENNRVLLQFSRNQKFRTYYQNFQVNILFSTDTFVNILGI